MVYSSVGYAICTAIRTMEGHASPEDEIQAFSILKKQQNYDLTGV